MASMGFSLGAVSSLMSLVDEKLQSEMSEASYVEVCNAMKYLYERKRGEEVVESEEVEEVVDLVESEEEEEVVSSPRYRERLARIRRGIVRSGENAMAPAAVRAPYLARIAAEARVAEARVAEARVVEVVDDVEVVGEVVAAVSGGEEERRSAIGVCREMLSRISVRVDNRIKTNALREKCVEMGVSAKELVGSVYSNKEVKEMEGMLVSKGVGMGEVKALYKREKAREIEKERARITERMEYLERRSV